MSKPARARGQRPPSDEMPSQEPVRLDQFRDLPLALQLARVWAEGVHLAIRYYAGETIALYHMRGDFFAEVIYDSTDATLLATDCFTDHEELNVYLANIDITNLLNPNS